MAMQNQVQHSKQAKEQNTVIVIEFDDTLFPTTKLYQILKRPKVNEPNHCDKYQGLSPEAKELKSKITSEEDKEFEKLSYETLELLISYVKQYSKHNICILTKLFEHKKWIKKSLSYVSYMDGYAMISFLICDIINGKRSRPRPKSVRSRIRIDIEKCTDFLKLHKCTRWKFLIFSKIINKKAQTSDEMTINNTFVIIGDRSYEFEAVKELRKLAEDIENVFIHSTKLKHKPTIKTLVKEQNLLKQLCIAGYDQSYTSCQQNGFSLRYFENAQHESGAFRLKQ